MKIAVVAVSYPNLSETFISREAEALAARGHDVVVLTKHAPQPGPIAPTTRLRVVPWTNEDVHRERPDVLYAMLGLLAHQRAYDISREHGFPVVYRVWSGQDTFVMPTPSFYEVASSHRHCRGVLVEDEFMAKYATREMRVRANRIHVVPNSINLDTFAPVFKNNGTVNVLTVARFVEKKGLIHGIRAFNAAHKLCTGSVYRIYGYGPEEERLRAAAGPGVFIHPAVTYEQLPGLYGEADVFLAPCIKTPSGDADGFPTTALEAMASGLPVIASDLLTAPCYIEPYHNGMLVPPGDESALEDAIVALCLSSGEMRQRLGNEARKFALEHLDLSRNIVAIESVLRDGAAASGVLAAAGGHRR